MVQHDEVTRERFVHAEFLGFEMRIERLVLLQRLLTGTNYSTGIVLQHTWEKTLKETSQAMGCTAQWDT